MSAAFITSMDTIDTQYTRTENGDLCLASTSSSALNLFFSLVRDLDDAKLIQMLRAAVAEAETPAAKVDLIVLAFHLRATRGTGKGEKSLSYKMLQLLADEFGTEAITAVLDLLPAFGCWKDLVALMALDQTQKALKDMCESLIIGQLQDDERELDQAKAEKRQPQLSLVGKWAPRENSAFDKKGKGVAKRLAQSMYGSANPAASARKYRKLVARLNEQLGTTEVLMAAGRWAEIKFASVASCALQRYRKAFLNETLKGKVLPSQEATGNRFPDDAARVAARQNLRVAITSKKGVQGKALMPHELVRKCMGRNGGSLSTLEADLLDAQWAKVREATVEAMAKAAEQRDLDVLSAAAPSAAASPLDSVAALKRSLPKHVDLGKMVALVDVSGSMTGTPMEVAIALGLLVSELAQKEFRSRVLTFETHPKWVDVAGCKTILDKVRKVQSADWGGSTNFEAACEQILEAAKRAKLKPDEIPDLIVFSDMQFDSAHRGGSNWLTAFERLSQRFAAVGKEICGEPYAAPRIIFWNLRANTVGFPVAKDTPNTQMLSGFSPALLKLVISGKDLVEEEEEVVAPSGSVKLVRSGPTPAQTYRAALDDAAFDVVRLKLAELEEGPFAGYDFCKAEEDMGFEVIDAD